MTIEEMELIRLALDTPEHNKYYVKHTTEAKMILNKHEKAINYSQCCKSDSELLLAFGKELLPRKQHIMLDKHIKLFLEERSK